MDEIVFLRWEISSWIDGTSSIQSKTYVNGTQSKTNKEWSQVSGNLHIPFVCDRQDNE